MPVSVVMAASGGDFDPIATAVRKSAQHFELVHALPSLRKAVGVLRRDRPTIFLMGLDLPDTPSLELIRTVSRDLPTRVVVMCRRTNAGAAIEALEAGAAGYIFTGTDDYDVVRLLKAAAA